jgi:hypothetical protein
MTESTLPLTIEQLAVRIGISTRTLRRRMKTRGTFGAVKVGRRWFFPISVLASELAWPG